jgi:uncharacterized protein YcfJ
MTRRIPQEARDLLTEHNRRLNQGGPAIAVAGGVIGAIVGFLVTLVGFGMTGGDGQAGAAAILFGLPLGGWIGAEVAVRRRR